jgi:hypothetical protein
MAAQLIDVDVVDGTTEPGTVEWRLSRDSYNELVPNCGPGPTDQSCSTNADNRRNFPGALRASSVREMVEAIERLVSQSRSQFPDGVLIRRLRIFGHGRPGIQVMGGDPSTNSPLRTMQVGRDGRLTNARVLQVLSRGYFAAGAVVELHGCQVAAGSNGRRLLEELHCLWGVIVRGGQDDQRADEIGNYEGSVVESSSGVCRAPRRR